MIKFGHVDEVVVGLGDVVWEGMSHELDAVRVIFLHSSYSNVYAHMILCKIRAVSFFFRFSSFHYPPTNDTSQQI